MSKKSKTNPATELKIEYLDCTKLVPDPRNSRQHNTGQLSRLQAAITEFGFTAPIIIDEHNQIVAGHARHAVAKMMRLPTVPCVRIGYLTPAQKRALAIADNKLAELAEWDLDALRTEFASLCDLEFPLELTGFDTAEIDIILDFNMSGSERSTGRDDVVQPVDENMPAITRLGDCWLLGQHRLCCGNALEHGPYLDILGDARASMVITDPPYNVPIKGHVSGLGKAKHREFAMASGEMSNEEFTEFLNRAMDQMVRYSIDGSLHFMFMDWRHISEITAAGARAFTEAKAMCVWKKSNAGMGSLYRSKHELVFVYKNGTAPHQNNVQLGKHGRYRTNVWEYAGANTFSQTRDEDLAAHPTVKPVAMIADAIRDCSKRGDIILDPFAGSGTILLAAERTGRKAAAIELDPHYVDTAVKRWQKSTGSNATLLASGETFDQTSQDRAAQPICAAEAPALGESSRDR